MALASRGRLEAAPFRPFHKPGAGCTACPRCWRSRRTAISSSYLIEQTPTSGCIYAAPRRRRDCSGIPAALPSPARAVVLARPNATLSELVRSTSHRAEGSRASSARRAVVASWLLVRGAALAEDASTPVSFSRVFAADADAGVGAFCPAPVVFRWDGRSAWTAPLLEDRQRERPEGDSVLAGLLICRLRRWATRR